MRNAIYFQCEAIFSRVKADNEHKIGAPNIVPLASIAKVILFDSFHLVLDLTRNGNRENTVFPRGALDVVFAFFTIIFHPLDSKECISKINQKALRYEFILSYEVVDYKKNYLSKCTYTLPSHPLRPCSTRVYVCFTSLLSMPRKAALTFCKDFIFVYAFYIYQLQISKSQIIIINNEL